MAKKFTFPLETLLKVRRRVEDQHKQALADEVRQLNEVRVGHEHLTSQMAAALDVARTAAGGPTVDVRFLAAQRYWIAHLQGGLLGNARQIATLEERVSQKRAELAEAARAVRVVETLKDKAKARYQLKHDKDEARFLDEVALQQHLRRRKEPC